MIQYDDKELSIIGSVILILLFPNGIYIGRRA